MPSGPRAAAEFPREVRLSDGRCILLRPSRASDAESVAEAIATASEQTLRNRFLVALHGLPLTELRARLEVQSDDECCLVATVGDRVIGGARFVRLSDRALGEIAVTVHDQFQRNGLGTALLRELIPIARQQGIRRFVGETLYENQAIIGLLSHFGPLKITRTAPGVRHVELDLNQLQSQDAV